MNETTYSTSWYRQQAALRALEVRWRANDPTLNESERRVMEFLHTHPEPNEAIKADLAAVAQYIKW